MHRVRYVSRTPNPGPGPSLSPAKSKERDDEPARRSRIARLFVALALSGANRLESMKMGPGLRRDDEPACRSAFARLLAGLVLSGGLVACGFHLRGQANYAFETMYVNSPASAPITTDLKRSLEGAGSARLVGAADQAQVVLDVNSVEDDKHILSLTQGGKVFEFLLTKRVLFRVHDSEGNDWLPTSEVVIRRTYTYSDTEVLAKTYEEQRLWRDMQADAVQQIVRRLEAAKKPA